MVVKSEGKNAYYLYGTKFMLMNDSLLHTKEHCVYPGEFNPLPETASLLNELERYGKIAPAGLPVNMDEFVDCFRIEMVIPGVQREEIFISVKENVLSVTILHKTCEDTQNKKLKIHEFDSGSFERHIYLPGNIDAEFIIANYSQGILKVFVPKTKDSCKNSSSHIAVY